MAVKEGTARSFLLCMSPGRTRREITHEHICAYIMHVLMRMQEQVGVCKRIPNVTEGTSRQILTQSNACVTLKSPTLQVNEIRNLVAINQLHPGSNKNL